FFTHQWNLISTCSSLSEAWELLCSAISAGLPKIHVRRGVLATLGGANVVASAFSVPSSSLAGNEWIFVTENNNRVRDPGSPRAPN
ncbi:MAG: hypothetical protein K2X42_04030, partial [Burkholderiaceae bacterium]|nr:hypothetical protein [Burkholderiaceae bacterium]